MGANEKAAATYHPNDAGLWQIVLMGPSPVTPGGYELGRGVADALMPLGWTPPRTACTHDGGRVCDNCPTPHVTTLKERIGL